MVPCFGLIDIPFGEWKALTLDRVSCYPLGAHRAPVPRPGLAPGWVASSRLVFVFAPAVSSRRGAIPAWCGLGTPVGLGNLSSMLSKGCPCRISLALFTIEFSINTGHEWPCALRGACTRLLLIRVSCGAPPGFPSQRSCPARRRGLERRSVGRRGRGFS